MKTLIQRIQESLAKEGLQARTNASRSWLQAKVKNLSATPNKLMQDRQRFEDRTIIGKMYFFYYDPKTKDSLPYYDRFPLVIPIDRYPDGFLGLNLHYIHPRDRVILLDKLSTTLNNKNYDETTKFRINYAYLSAASKAYEATPCIKRYLFRNVESRFLRIDANEWDIAVTLPVERFEKAIKQKVFRESRKKY
jgi:hypothetical protein